MIETDSDGPGNDGSGDWLLNLDKNIVEQCNRRSLANDKSTAMTLLLEMKDEETGLWPRGVDGKEWTFQQKSKVEVDESETGDGIVGLYNMG